MNKLGWRAAWLHYGLASLLIMTPLLLPGFILTLDLVFTPHIAWPNELSNTFVLQAMLHILNLVIPADVLEKILLGLVLLLSAVGAHRLVEYAFLRSGKKNRWVLFATYFAGLLYMINPFVYDRFMAGQHLVLLGYALLPFFVTALLRFIDNPGWQTSLRSSVWAITIAWVSIHHIGMMALMVIIAVVLGAWKYRHKVKSVGQLAKWSLISTAIVLMANSFWLVPTLSGSTPIAQAALGFGQAQHDAFATVSGPLGAIGNVVRLQGFWLEERNMFALPQDLLPGWGIVMLLVLVLVGIGVVVAARRQHLVAGLLGASAIVAIIAAATSLIAWLSDVVPFIAGYREPQKFVGLLALAYAYFGAVGVTWLLARLAQKSIRSMQVAAVVVLVLPFLSAPTMLWGFANQLSPRQYPADWVELNSQLANDSSATNVLFLPWHQYMHFNFAGRVIATPASKFFNTPTIVSDDPEYKNAGPTTPNMLNRRIEQEALMLADTTTHMGQALATLGFSHVILAKDYDFERYAYLDSQTDLVLERETDNLKLYKIVVNKGVAYGQ